MKVAKVTYTVRMKGRLVGKDFTSRDKAVQFARKRIRKSKAWKIWPMRSLYSNPTISQFGYEIRRVTTETKGTTGKNTGARAKTSTNTKKTRIM